MNMTEALEDIGEVSVRNGASLVDDWSGGKMVSVTAGWISGGNSTGNGGGIINSADTYFRKSAFTLYTDVMLTGDGNEKDGMIIIGTADGSFKIRRNSDGGAELSVGSVSGDALCRNRISAEYQFFQKISGMQSASLIRKTRHRDMQQFMWMEAKKR